MTVSQLIEKLKDCPQDAVVHTFRIPVYKNERPATWEPIGFVVQNPDGVYLYYND